MKTRFIDAVLLLKDSCIKKEEEIVNRFSVSPSEYRGLLAIVPGEVLTGNAYSSRMGLSVSRGSRVIEKLLKSGYLKHEDCDDDRRCNMVSLTAKGIKVRTEIDKMLDECEDELESRISKSELISTKDSIEKIATILNDKD